MIALRWPAEVALLVGELVAVDGARGEALVDHVEVAGGEAFLEDAAHGLLVRVGVHDGILLIRYYYPYLI